MNLVRKIAFSMTVASIGCAGTPEGTSDRPVRSPCAGLECFRERDIREVQLLDPDTMIVFVGPQRCAFRMEVQGSDCGYIGFTVDFDLDRRSRVLGDQAPICLNDRPYLRDPLDPTSRSAEGSMPGGRGPAPASTDLLIRCRVDQIIPLSDDELLEAYVETGSQPPLPPVGTGEISVGEGEEEGGETDAEGTPSELPESEIASESEAASQAAEPPADANSAGPN